MPINKEYTNMEQDMVSTTALGKIIGIKAKPFLFEEILRRKYVEKPEKNYLLTDLGQSDQIGGRYRTTSDGSRFIVWPITLGVSFREIKQSLLDQLNFRLFHITHINNLISIFQNGLFSHNAAPHYLDISNINVNNRRKRDDTIHKKSLHEYAILYFNPRNTMLYQRQREYKSDIVILEISKQVCFSNYTLFTDRNAAIKTAKFAYCLSDVKKFDWLNINSSRWVINGVANLDKNK